MNPEPTIFMHEGIPNLKLGDGNLIFPLVRLETKEKDKTLIGISINSIIPKKVGDYAHTKDESHPFMRIVSDNPKSLGILIKQLQKAKEMIENINNSEDR